MLKEQIQQLPTPRTDDVWKDIVFFDPKLPKHARTLEQQLEAVMRVVEEQRQMLCVCSMDYNDPRFTDRRQTGPEINKVIESATLTLATIKEMNK